jgi:hypothetical protein
MLYRGLILLFFVSVISLTASAQDITGIWKGYFISDGGDYYKLEFQITRNGTSGAKGVSYSYLDVRFYGKATMTGSYIKGSSLKIREIKTVEVKSTLGGATCIMNYNLNYSKSGKEEFLDGTYLGKYESPYQLNPPGKWGDCGGGKVHLRKVTSSDFYVEPFLRNKVKDVPIIDNEPPRRIDSTKTKPTVAKTNPPITKPPVAKTNPPAKKPVTDNKPVVTEKPPVKKPVVVNNPPVKKPVIDTSAKTQPVVKVNPPPVKVPDVLKTRTNELVKAITVNSREVTVKLYDNGQIDGDTISVYLDKKMVIGSKLLTASPLTVKFTLDDEDDVHELVMVAENLGSIPPNTSLMIVEAGTQRFDVRITSTEQKNAMVRFRYLQPK